MSTGAFEVQDSPNLESDSKGMALPGGSEQRDHEDHVVAQNNIYQWAPATLDTECFGHAERYTLRAPYTGAYADKQRLADDLERQTQGAKVKNVIHTESNDNIRIITIGFDPLSTSFLNSSPVLVSEKQFLRVLTTLGLSNVYGVLCCCEIQIDTTTDRIPVFSFQVHPPRGFCYLFVRSNSKRL